MAFIIIINAIKLNKKALIFNSAFLSQRVNSSFEVFFRCTFLYPLSILIVLSFLIVPEGMLNQMKMLMIIAVLKHDKPFLVVHEIAH
jgi:hypothetical protein